MPEVRARWLAALLLAVLATLIGGASAFGEDGARRNSDNYEGGPPDRAPLSATATNEGARLAVCDRPPSYDGFAHVYDDRSQPARALARQGGDRLAPQTARAVHASELVESPLWTATKTRTSAQNAYRHFADHGADFPDIQNSVEYVAKAQNFLRTPPGGTLTRVRSNGDVVRWHPGSNTFGVMDAGGAPRTFFRPDPSVHGYANNWDYFYAQ